MENVNKSSGEQQRALEWQVHLAKRSPQKLAVVLFMLFFVPLLGIVLMQHWFFALIGFWMVFTATTEFLFPIRYRMDGQEIRQRTLLTLKVMRWEQVKRTVWTKNGVLLSPLARPSRLDAFRGIYLWFGEHELEIRHGIACWASHLSQGQEQTLAESTTQQ